jgi:protein-L-isoaspartate(D-aspartate) O-methyltransferase
MTRPQTGLQHMLSDIDQLLAQYAAATGVGALSPRIRAALRATPRDRFTPEPVKPLAYADRPQPIGYGQTMSQPFMVALMSELLEPESSDNILEIGTGSGCQAAILAQSVRDAIQPRSHSRAGQTRLNAARQYGIPQPAGNQWKWRRRPPGGGALRQDHHHCRRQ